MASNIRSATFFGNCGYCCGVCGIFKKKPCTSSYDKIVAAQSWSLNKNGAEFLREMSAHNCMCISL